MYTILLQVTKCSYLPIVIDELDLFNANPPCLLLSCPFYKDTYIFFPLNLVVARGGKVP